MRPILAGIETEYGLWIEGRGAEQQVEDSAALVRSYPGESFCVWDYRFENPRLDLRGFNLEKLAHDPADAEFDAGRQRRPIREEHADRILYNGARFYNDHGHPEYATPETWSLDELEHHDLAGELVVRRAAAAWSLNAGLTAKLYKNNTDFHGASYGTHENYLVPRSVGVDSLIRAVMPMLIVRQVLTGAGKVGAESKPSVPFQLSQRADFFVEPVNAETLFRRPIFNTRDEPHADASHWIRLHVISGDANMISRCTRRKVGLIKLALALLECGEAPEWRFKDPVRAFQELSRSGVGSARVELEGNSWTDADCIFESYFSAAESVLDPGDPGCIELLELMSECRQLLHDRTENPDAFRREVDWAAKKFLVDAYCQEMGLRADDPSLCAVDLAYHDLDSNEGLYFGLLDADEVVSRPRQDEIEARLHLVFEKTRAKARSIAVRKFSSDLASATWGNLQFASAAGVQNVYLDPAKEYGRNLDEAASVDEFIAILKGQS